MATVIMVFLTLIFVGLIWQMWHIENKEGR